MSLPSPVVLVNGSSVSNGINVAANSTVTITLANSTGAKNWQINVLSTDDSSSAASIAATLNPTGGPAGSVTYTQPNHACTVVLQSIVGVNGLGLDANSQAQSSLTTTFEVCTLTGSALRLVALNESFEGNAAFGWIVKLNAAIVAFASGGAPAGTGYTHVTGGAWDTPSNNLSLATGLTVTGTTSLTGATTMTGALTQSGGAFSLTGSAASTITTAAGGLTLDASAGVSIANSTATAGVLIGRAAMAAGVVIAAGAASSFRVTGATLTLGTLTSGGVTISCAAGGQLSMTGNGASVLQDATSTMRVDAQTTLQLGNTTATAVTLGRASGSCALTIAGNAASTFQITGANLTIGTLTSGTLILDAAGNNVQVGPTNATSVSLGRNGQFITASAPILGDSSANPPYSAHGDSGVVTPPSDADYTVTAAQYQYTFIAIATTNFTATRNVIMPNPSGNQGYWKVFNKASGAQSYTVKCGSGAQTVTIASGTHILYLTNNNVTQCS